MLRLSSPRRVFLTFCVVCLIGLGEGLRIKEQPVELCSIRKAGDALADPVSVFLVPGNGRSFSFGDHASTTESTVHCNGAKCDATPKGSVDSAEDCPACPCDVADSHVLSASIQVMFDKIQPVCSHAQSDQPVDLLLIGLGGGTLHRHVRRTCPNGTRVRSVEVDPRVAGVAQRYFGLELTDGVSEVSVDDALSAVNALAAQRTLSADTSSAPALGANGWDVVGIDCFIGHGETPESCRSPEFISAVHALLKPSGVVLQHIWHTSPDNGLVEGEFEQTFETYERVFGNSTVSVTSIPRDPSVRWDDVIVARASAPAQESSSEHPAGWVSGVW